LFLVAQTLDSLGPCFGARKRRQQHSRKNRNDGNNNEQFDQREAIADYALMAFLLSSCNYQHRLTANEFTLSLFFHDAPSN
jgi:hypothetical protein